MNPLHWRFSKAGLEAFDRLRDVQAILAKEGLTTVDWFSKCELTRSSRLSEIAAGPSSRASNCWVSAIRFLRGKPQLQKTTLNRVRRRALAATALQKMKLIIGISQSEVAFSLPKTRSWLEEC